MRITDTALSRTQPGLREGSVVIGKVLEKNGTSFLISLAGQKISVSSKLDLEAGSVFKGILHVKGEGENRKVEIALLKDNPQNTATKESVLYQKLSSLGLSPDPENIRLVNFMMSMGTKIESQKIKNALLKAEKLKGEGTISEKAEAVLLAEEKGLDIENVNFDFGESGGHSQEKHKNAQSSAQEIASKKKDAAPEVCDIQSPLTDDEKEFSEDFIKSINLAAVNGLENQKAGILSLFNTLAVKKEKSDSEKSDFRHWFSFPFTWNFNGYSGTIKILQKYPEKITEKIIISMKNDEKQRNFEIDFEGGKVCNVKKIKEGENDGSFEEQFDSLFEKLKGLCIEI